MVGIKSIKGAILEGTGIAPFLIVHCRYLPVYNCIQRK
jgi:hypothetical protein